MVCAAAQGISGFPPPLRRLPARINVETWMEPPAVRGLGGRVLSRERDLRPAAEGFPLSIHGAWMLQRGIEQYASDTPDRSADVNDCLVRYETAMAVATRLRDWCAELAPDYLKFNIDTLGILLKELEAEKERLMDAQDQE